VQFPVYLAIGSLKIHPHPVCEALAYALAFALYLALRKRWRDPIPESTRMSVIAGAAVGAALGSKLLFLLEDPVMTWQHVGDIAFLMGGKTIVGGLLGGLAGVEITKRLAGETRSTGDLFVLPLCLGIAIGRIGCFLTGLGDHTYGSATSLPWGVDFGDGIPRHPAQLYEIVVLAAIAAWALARRAHLARSGDLFRGFMLLYLSWRFVIDFMKPDARVVVSAIQIACLAGIAYYARDARRVFFAANAGELAT
jgi:phosphatidylglycerol:prolipoprotein diacylglycerol transferase